MRRLRLRAQGLDPKGPAGGQPARTGLLEGAPRGAASPEPSSRAGLTPRTKGPSRASASFPRSEEPATSGSPPGSEGRARPRGRGDAGPLGVPGRLLPGSERPSGAPAGLKRGTHPCGPPRAHVILPNASQQAPKGSGERGPGAHGAEPAAAPLAWGARGGLTATSRRGPVTGRDTRLPGTGCATCPGRVHICLLGPKVKLGQEVLAPRTDDSSCQALGNVSEGIFILRTSFYSR